MLLWLFNQNELDASDTDLALRLSAFNFCSAEDHILPFTDGSISAGDRAHLWGMYTGILPGGATTPQKHRGFIVNVGRGMG